MGWLINSLHRVSRNTQLFFRRRKAKTNPPRRRSRVLTIESLESKQLLTIDLTTLPHQIVGTQDAGFTAKGAWQTYNESDAYQGTFAYHAGTAAGDGDAATFDFPNVDPTQSYQCFVAYPAAGNRATNAPFTVDDGATAISTVMVNEQMIPTDATGNGMAWQSIGVYQAGSGDLNVTLGDAADGYVIANAVCLAAVPATTAAPSVVCTGDPTYSESPNSNWQSYADPSAYNGDFRYCTPGTGANTATWSFTDVDPTAQYQVYATWTAASNRANNAPYTLSDGSNPLAVVNMNQQFAPSDATIGGQGWESLGTYTAASGTLNVSLSDNADGVVVANAVTIVQTQPPSTAPSMVDNSNAAFSEGGSGWQGYSDTTSVNGGFRYCTAGTGENTATWTFAGVNPTAQYQIYATWSAAGNRATNAPYTISDGGNLLTTVDMNQQFAPGDTTIDGQSWASLGVFTASSGTLVVGLSDNANGIVNADAIRIQQIQPVSPAPSLLDTAAPSYSEVGSGWQGYCDTSDYGGSFRYCAAGTGENTATWSFAGVSPTTQYQVYATWSAAGNRASNAPYTISDGGTALATVNMNQQFAPINAQIDGQGWESLGVYSVASGTLDVSLSDNANGIVNADAIMILPLQTPATPPTLPAIVDNGGGAVCRSRQRLARLSDPSAYEGDFRYALPGTGPNTAQWTFQDLPNGEYEVFSTWSPASNRADNAPYTISDGGAALATVPMNQQNAPSDLTADGQGWASLGTFALPSPLAPLPGGEGNTLTVSLSDDADGIVVADAVRLAVVNYAPTVLSTAPVNVPQGTTDSSLNLASVFNNPNGPLSQLTFTVETNSNSALVPAAWVEDQTLEFAAAPGLSGTSNITILATDPAGESVQATIPIVVAPLGVPAAPSGLTATAVSTGEIDLTWTNNAGSGTTFQVQRATNSAFTQNVSLVTIAAGATSCTNTGLAANTTYYYRAWATDSAGNSLPGNTATASTPVATALPSGWSDADIGSPSPPVPRASPTTCIRSRAAGRTSTILPTSSTSPRRRSPATRRWSPA